QLSGGSHYGLTIMRARAERVGGSLEVDSAPGGGTKIIARLPLESRNQELGIRS
ncbi:MAG: histidine kinase, partial [Bacteroidia bacterium]|nr:histidine kinase [Bacteroidia bacterium]